MFSLRTARQPAFLRSALSSSRATTSPQVAVAGRRFASEDYGSGAQKPGTPNPAVDQEHPGPPPPKAAQQGQQQQQPSQGQGQQQSGEASKQQSDSNSKSTSAPQPKILSESPPAQGEEPEDVAKHNRELEQRADKAHEKVRNEDAKDDKVPKGFWQGQGGVDKDP